MTPIYQTLIAIRLSYLKYMIQSNVRNSFCKFMGEFNLVQAASK